MPNLHSMLNRRTFIKFGAQFLMFVGYLKIIRITGIEADARPTPSIAQEAAIGQSPFRSHPYGTGAYGEGPYPGYDTFLPLVKQ